MRKEEVIRVVKDQYGMDDVKASPLGEKTGSSDVWLVEHGGERYVLKGSLWYAQFAPNPAGALEAVYEVMNLLAPACPQLQTAQRTSAGHFTLEVHAVPVALLTYKEGVSFDGSPAHFAASGAGLARFHSAGRVLLEEAQSTVEGYLHAIPFEKPYEESRELYMHGGFREVLACKHTCSAEATCTMVRDALPVLDETIGYIENAFATQPHCTEGILHNDFGYANALYASDGSLSALLDADQLGKGLLVHDVGNTLASLVSKYLKSGTRTDLPERVQAFLRAYHAVLPLPRSEYRLLIAASQRWDMLRILRTLRRHHFENDRLPELVPKISARFLPRVRSLSEWLSFMTDEWLIDTLGTNKIPDRVGDVRG